MKVLIASDGSKYSAAALKSVCERSWPKDTQFMIISVAESLIVMVNPLLAPYERCAFEDIKVEHEEFARAAGDKLKMQFPDAEVLTEVVEGSADQIVHMARQWDADFVVVGSHGRRGLEKFLLGSVSEAVVSQACCSVEVIKLARVPGVKKVDEHTSAVSS